MKFWGASVMQRAAEEKSGFLEQETREEIQEIETRMEEVMQMCKQQALSPGTPTVEGQKAWRK